MNVLLVLTGLLGHIARTENQHKPIGELTFEHGPEADADPFHRKFMGKW